MEAYLIAKNRKDIEMKKLVSTKSIRPKECRLIKRDELKNKVYEKLKETGDPAHIKPTLDCVLDMILEIRLDDRKLPTNRTGRECVLTTLGAHVYTWHNIEFIEAVKDCTCQV